MKKKNKIIMFLIIIFGCFCCTACVGDVTRGIRHAGFTLSDNEFVCDLLVSSNSEDTSSEKIRYLTSSKAITESGKVYDISLGQIFSNKQNCKESDFTKRVVAIIDDSVVKGADGKYYYLNSQGDTKMYAEVSENDQAYSIYNILFSDASIRKVITVDGNSGLYLALKSDGNIYKLIITRSDSKAPYSLAGSDIAYSKGSYGEIIDFNIDNNNVSTYILTTDRIYRSIRTNSDECSKYADIECKYELKEDVDLAKYSDYILGYTGQTLITTYGKVFTVS